MTQTITLSLACDTNHAALILTLHEMLASWNTDEEIQDCLENSCLVIDNLEFLMMELINWICDAAIDAPAKKQKELDDLIAQIHKMTKPGEQEEN